MERKVQFVIKNNKDKWLVWLNTDGIKVLLTDELKSEEEVKSYLKDLVEKAF